VRVRRIFSDAAGKEGRTAMAPNALFCVWEPAKRKISFRVLKNRQERIDGAGISR